jgi:HK97 family phage major capsid protein
MNISVVEKKLKDAVANARATEDRITSRADGRDFAPHEQAEIDRANAQVASLKATLDKLHADQGMRNQIDQLLGEGRSTSSAAGGGSRGRTLGAQFVQSEKFQDFVKHRGWQAQRWSTGVIELQSELLDSDAGSPGSGGDLIVPDFRPGVVMLPQRRVMIPDLIPQALTDSNTIVSMRETLFDNAADTVAEGALKPESSLRFDQTSDRVYKIAHWLPVTDEMLEDVPALRGVIDARLRLGVQLAEENKLLHGAASPEELTGILNRPGLAPPIAAGGSPAENNADAIALQIAAIETDQQVEVTGIVMNPTDWLNLRILKVEGGEYLGNGPFEAPQRPTLWGKTVVVTPLMTVGTALVGAFRSAAQIFRRGGLRVEASNSHEDYFVRNLTAIRAESRMSLVLVRNAAFGVVTGL